MTNASSDGVNGNYTHFVENHMCMEIATDNSSQIVSQSQADVEIGEIMENVKKAATSLQVRYH